MDFFIKRRETWIWFVRLCLELNKGGLNTVNKIKKYIPWKLLDGYISSTLSRGASCWSHQGAISELYSTEYSSHYPDDFATNAKPRHANFVCIRTSASRKNRSKIIELGMSVAGAQKLVFSVRGLLNSKQDFVCVKVDMRNAYNE